jgi:hypothetical protein
MQKIITAFALVALVGATVSMSLVNAAGITLSVSSLDRQTVTLGLPAAVDFAGTGSEAITLKLTTLSDGNVVDLSTNVLTSALVGAGAVETLTNSGNTSGVVLITNTDDDTNAGDDLVIEFTNPLSDNTAYLFTYSDSLGNFGASAVAFGTANQVTVSATVQPVLSFNLDDNTIELGSLIADVFGTDSVTFDMSTSASGGADVSISSNGLASATHEIGVTNIHANQASAGNSYYKVSTGDTVVFDTTNRLSNDATNVAQNGGATITGTNNLVHNGTGAETVTDKEVTIGAQINALTETGTYSDTLTFVVTPSF